MAFFKNIEYFFEKHIEGFFRKRFGAGIQPVEIGKRLVRAMEENLQVSVTKTYAPNHYTVCLNPGDLGQIQSLEVSLTEELAQYIARQAEQQGVTIAGLPVVDMREDTALSFGDMKIETSFTQLPVEQREGGRELTVHQGTQVFEGVKVTRIATARHKAIPCAVLRVSAGVDIDKEWELGSDRMYIGRRQTNEIALNDINASRVHAYVAMEEGRHVLHDAKSLNGTYVNDERIVHRLLCSGDRIRVGYTTLVYEVM